MTAHTGDSRPELTRSGTGSLQATNLDGNIALHIFEADGSKSTIDDEQLLLDAAALGLDLPRPAHTANDVPFAELEIDDAVTFTVNDVPLAAETVGDAISACINQILRNAVAGDQPNENTATSDTRNSDEKGSSQ